MSAQQWKLRQRKWGGIYRCEVCPPEQSLCALKPYFLGNGWTLPTGGKLSINLLFSLLLQVAFALLNCLGLDPWVFLHLVSILNPAEEGSGKSGVIGHPASVQDHPTTLLQYTLTCLWKSSHSVYIQESSVLHWGYYDFFYMRRIKMIQLPSSFSSVNHQSLCQLISWWASYQTIRFLPIDFVSKATTLLTSQFPSIVGDLFFRIGWLYSNCIVLNKILLFKFQS